MIVAVTVTVTLTLTLAVTLTVTILIHIANTNIHPEEDFAHGQNACLEGQARDGKAHYLTIKISKDTAEGY